jgi:hypothetical protein
MKKTANNHVFLQNAEQHGITGFQSFHVESGAKISDLSAFFENTRCRGKTCIKTAYMVKFGRNKRDVTPNFLMLGVKLITKGKT